MKVHEAKRECPWSLDPGGAYERVMSEDDPEHSLGAMFFDHFKSFLLRRAWQAWGYIERF